MVQTQLLLTTFNNTPVIASSPICFISRLPNPRVWPQVSFDFSERSLLHDKSHCLTFCSAVARRALRSLTFCLLYLIDTCLILYLISMICNRTTCNRTRPTASSNFRCPQNFFHPIISKIGQHIVLIY